MAESGPEITSHPYKNTKKMNLESRPSEKGQEASLRWVGALGGGSGKQNKRGTPCRGKWEEIRSDVRSVKLVDSQRRNHRHVA